MVSQYEMDKVYMYESRGMITMHELEAFVHGHVTLKELEEFHLWR